MARRRRYDDDDDYDDAAPRRRRDRDDDYDDDDYDDAPRRSSGGADDVPGIIGLVCGGIAAVCLLAGCILGCLWFIAPVFALAGGITSLFAKGNLKTAGLIVNGVVLLLTILAVVLVIVVGVGFLAALPAAGQPPRAR